MVAGDTPTMVRLTKIFRYLLFAQTELVDSLDASNGLQLHELRNMIGKIDSSELIWTSSESDEIFDTPRLLRYYQQH